MNIYEEMVPTVIVERDGMPYRINMADFDATKDVLHSSSHNIPPGYVAPVVAPPAPAPIAPPAPVGGKAGKAAAPAPAFTMPTGDGKFFRSDDKGRRLNADNFDTAELAAASPVTINPDA